MTQSSQIAIVDDDAAQRMLLSSALERAGYATKTCANGKEALEILDQFAAMLLDVRMPGLNGLEVLRMARKLRPELPVILLTAFIDVRDAVAAIKLGAVDYLEKPVDLDELIAAVDDMLGVPRDIPGQPARPILPKGIVAESALMRSVFDLALRAAETEVTVLLLGESGVGKEVVAEFIHRRSARAAKPCVQVDCASLPKDIIESELFGHEKGAFTGAESARRGQFETADGGVIFLDEIGELPAALQPKFLRVLETGRFRRVGGNDEISTDARVVAATNRDLAAEVEKGSFRQDLFYRLNVFPLTIPPLRERPDDILPLADLFLDGRKQRLAPAAQRLLMAYDWPGNVRELKNALDRASILADGSLILPNNLPPNLQDAAEKKTHKSVLVGDMQEIERTAILQALEKTGGNKTKAAQILNISRRNLIYKLRSYGL